MTSETVRVLLVEEDPDDVVLVRAALQDDPSTTFALTVVSEAGQASTQLAAHTFDVALLDLSLPDAQGLDALSTILGYVHDTPIIVLTGLDDEAVAFQAMQGGAQDYLVKGRVTDELLVRSIRYARERHRLLAERTRHFEHELEVAALLQRAFLPSTVPTAGGHDIGGYLQASGQIGGDFYDFIGLPDGCLAVALGDASGKGIPGAILMAKTQAVLRSEVNRHLAPGALVHHLNRNLCETQGQYRFVTFFYGVLSLCDSQFTYVSAGHPRALLLNRGEPEYLTSTGPPLGLFADAAYQERTVSIGTANRLVVYSDGVSEAQNQDDRFFDETGICDVVAQYPDDAASDLARLICDAAKRFENGNPDPGDDKTVVVIRRLAR